MSVRSAATRPVLLVQSPSAQTFRSLYGQGFARIAACTGRSEPADPERNAAAILALAQRCHEAGAAVALFPELCVSAYAIEDLFLQETLLDAVEAAVARIVEASASLMPVLVVGAPLRWGSRLYNCALAIHRGTLLGVVPKSYLPNYREFYEKRHFAPGAGLVGETIAVGGLEVAFGTDLLFAPTDLQKLVLAIEICEDLWVPASPGAACSSLSAQPAW